MNRLRYLLDENIPHALRDQLLLRRQDMEILAVGDESAPPLATSDEDILRWIERHGYVLVSRNRRTMPYHLRTHLEAGGHLVGIILLRPRRSMGEYIDELIFLWDVARGDEYQDTIVYLPL